MNKVVVVALSLFFLTLSACSPRSLPTQEGGMGLLTGAAVGTGVGLYFAKEVGSTAKNVLVNGAIGGATGLIAGGVLHEYNQSRKETRDLRIRQARMIGENQQIIDETREEMYESSAWGQSETRSWNERYHSENPSRPYLGPHGQQ